MPDDPDALPTLHEATLDEAELEALLRDVERVSELVRIRWRPTTPPGAPTLAETRAGLRNASISAAQIHYRYEGSLWCDTIDRVGSSFRLIRIRQEWEATERD